MTIHELMAVCEAQGLEPSVTAKGFKSRCPAHHGQKLKLDVTEGQNGAILLRCWTRECEFADIVAALGLTMRDMFPANEVGRGRHRSGKSNGKTMTRQTTKPKTDQPAGATAKGPSEPPPTLDWFSKTKLLPLDFLKAACISDLNGSGLVFPHGEGFRDHVRTLRGKGDRRFTWKGPGVPAAYTIAVLFEEHRPDEGGDFIVVVEGESDALTLWYHGVPAVGLPGNTHSKKLASEHVESYQTVYVWREPEEPGEVMVGEVVSRLASIGYKGEVRVLASEMDKDPSDLHVRLQGDRQAFLAELNALMAAAVTPDAMPTRPEKPTAKSKGSAQAEFYKKLVVVSADSIQATATEWLIPDRLPVGYLTLVAGDGKIGKSSVIYKTAADLSRGDCCLGLNYTDPVKTKTLIFGAEDDPSSRVIPFLVTADADLSKVCFYQDAVDDEGKSLSFSFEDIEPIRAVVRETGCRLLVFDPASAYLPSNVSDNSEVDVRVTLAPLAKMAREEKIAVILIKHTPKGNTYTASHKFIGSAAWKNICRSSWLILPDQEQKDERMLFDVGSSLTSKQKAIRYAIRQPEQDRLNALKVHDAFVNQAEADRQRLLLRLSEITFLGECDDDPDEFMSRGTEGVASRVDTMDCKEWLKDRLGPEHAWVEKEIKTEAEKLGYSDYAYRTAKSILKRDGGLQTKARSFRGTWYIAFGDPLSLPLGPPSSPPPVSTPVLSSREGVQQDSKTVRLAPDHQPNETSTQPA